MIEKIANEVIRLANRKPEFRKKLEPVLQKIAFRTDPKYIAVALAQYALPVLFRKRVQNIPVSPEFSTLTASFLREGRDVLETYWSIHEDEFQDQEAKNTLMSDLGLITLFMLLLVPNPIDWISRNNRNYLQIFKGRSFIDFYRQMKKESRLKKYVTDTGDGALVNLIMNIGYQAAAH